MGFIFVLRLLTSVRVHRIRVISIFCRVHRGRPRILVLFWFFVFLNIGRTRFRLTNLIFYFILF